MSNFDEILNKRIGFGKYQIISIILISLVDFDDGVQLVLMPLIIPIIKTEWNLSIASISILTSIFYIGMCFGSFITGKIADAHGRRFSLVHSSFIQFAISLSFIFITDIYSMIIIRFLYGFIFGFSIPLTTSMISEITPLKYRGKMLVIINFFLTFGKLYGCLIAFFCLENMYVGNWKAMMAFSSFTPFTVFLFTHFFLKESPRFLIAASRFEEAFDVMDFMIKKNNENAEILTAEEKEGLMNFQKNTFDLEEKASIKSLFSKKYRNTTIGLWILWFSINFMYYGQLTILPFLLGNSKKGLDQMVIAILGETPAILFTLFFIERPNFGRKNSLIICFSMAGFLNLIGYFLPKDHVALSFSVSRFFMKECFAFLYAFTSESYGTLNRTLGYGLSCAIGRVGASIMPYILFFFYEIDNYSCFLCFFFFSSISAVACSKIKYDTTGRNLDLIEKESNGYELVEKKTIL